MGTEWTKIAINIVMAWKYFNFVADYDTGTKNSFEPQSINFQADAIATREKQVTAQNVEEL